MIAPSIGRVVWYRPSFLQPTDQAHAALVTFVHSDTMVNLAVFDANGEQYGKTSVFLRQEGVDTPVGDFCEWMPYQIGQAKKNA